MSKPFAWSHSALSSFETCPKKHYHIKIKKDVSDPPGPDAQWGLRVHKALEDRLKKGTPLPPSMAGYESIVRKIEGISGEPLVETQFAITREFKPTGWFDKDVWCRAVIDAGKVGITNGLLVDWKTGKMKEDSDQLKLSALIGFAHIPTLQSIASSFVWLKDKKMTKDMFSREQIPVLWQEFMPRVTRMEKMIEAGEFPPMPSGLCRRHCPVKSCEFHGG